MKTTKCLGYRMKKVMSSLINNDQTGFLQNRYIGENIMKMIEILEYTDSENIAALSIFIDFEKAFDRLEWKFIQKVLTSFNFGPNFKFWIDTIYRNSSRQILNNCWATAPFTWSRGVRQECPLSQYLFVICAEILGILIRHNTQIEGINIAGKEYRISQYANDANLTIKASEACLQEVIEVFEWFERISGLKVNYDKSEIMPIGILNKRTVTVLCSAEF